MVFVKKYGLTRNSSGIAFESHAGVWREMLLICPSAWTLADGKAPSEAPLSAISALSSSWPSKDELKKKTREKVEQLLGICSGRILVKWISSGQETGKFPSIVVIYEACKSKSGIYGKTCWKKLSLWKWYVWLCVSYLLRHCIWSKSNMLEIK